jgi:putative SOS response-associated peptidase YedK
MPYIFRIIATGERIIATVKKNIATAERNIATAEIITNYNWGLIPEWSKDDEIRKMTLNAKLKQLKKSHHLKIQ